MKVVWTRVAMKSLKEIYSYRKINFGLTHARKFRKAVFDKTKHLKTFPQIGKKEESLADKKGEYRFIFEGNYKIIYRVEKEEVYIANIFNMRQNPDKSIF